MEGVLQPGPGGEVGELLPRRPLVQRTTQRPHVALMMID